MQKQNTAFPQAVASLLRRNGFKGSLSFPQESPQKSTAPPATAGGSVTATSGGSRRRAGRHHRQNRAQDFWKSVALRESLFTPLNPVLEKLFSLDKLRELYQSVREPDATNIFNRILKKMSVGCSVSETDLARVPPSSATVVVANHPFGILDGILLGALLLKVRPDLKILTNYLLTGIPELDEYCIPLDPFATGSPDSGMAPGVNRRGLRGCRKNSCTSVDPRSNSRSVSRFRRTRCAEDGACPVKVV